VCLGAGFDAAVCVGGHFSCPAAVPDNFGSLYTFASVSSFRW